MAGTQLQAAMRALRECRPAGIPERRTMMQRQVMWLFLLATVLVPALVGAVTEADFEAKTTQNLLNLCTAPSSDPYYREAIHFCHGYLVGAYQYHVAETSGEGSKPLICFPTP